MTIRVGEEEFRAHRLVLADSSPVLKAWLSEKWSTDGVCEFSEEFVESSIVEDLLNYFYCGRITLTTVNVYSICTAAHFLHVPELLSASEKFLSENIDSSSVLDLFYFSDKLQLEILRKSCVDHLFTNYKDAFCDSKILSFSAEQLKLIMNEMNSKSEQGYDLQYKEPMFKAVIKWVEHNSAERLPFLPSILKTIPLYDLSTEFLRTVVASQGIISDSHACSKLVLDAWSNIPKSKLKISQEPTRLYCFGGSTNSSSVSCLNLSTGKWANSTAMPAEKASFGGAAIGFKIYLCGGYDKNNSQQKLNTVEMFDCSTSSWSQLQPMLQPRWNPAIAHSNNFIYVAGGYDDPGYMTTTVFRYCIKNNEWKTMKPMNLARQHHRLVQLGGLLYVIGGYDSKSVEQYNPQTDQWTTMADSQYIHSNSSPTSLNGKIYVHSSRGFEEYTPQSNTWRTLISPHNNQGSCLVSVKDKLWLLGGNPSKKSVYEFDTHTEQWTQLADMNVERSDFCAFAVRC